MATVTTNEISDEEVEILVDGTQVAIVDHETYGWTGMAEALGLVRAVATALGAETD